MSSQSSIRLVCFDLDGTLIHGTTSCLHIAQQLGWGDLMMRLEEDYAAGRISNETVATEDGKHYAGRSLEEIHGAMKTTPFIDNISIAVSQLQAMGIRCIITTVTWKFVAQLVAQRFGFDDYTGVEMPIENGMLSGIVSRHFEASDKVLTAQAHARELGISASQVLAIGDSRSDIPLFQWAGISVALNATKQAAEIATYKVNTRDLLEALRLVPGLSISCA
jgi:phosphoserine phosphatase